MPTLRALTALAVLSALFPLAAAAQSKTQFLEAFAGEWVVFDPAYSTSSAPCAMTLSNDLELKGVVEESQLRPVAATRNCVAPLSTVTAWDIEQSQLVLYAQQNEVVARLGGNQGRVTGDIVNSFDSMILERPSGDAHQAVFSQALKQHRCIYLGLSSTCATPEDLSPPVISEDGSAVGSLQVLARLNVRDQPRRDAGVVGTLPADICLKVNFCTIGADGIWCRARFGENSGWVAKTALRQEKWPVVTYVNGCEGK